MGLRIRGLAGGLLAAGLLLGCGATPAPPPGSPPGSPQCPTADLPEDIEGGAPALPEGVFVLQGPADAKGRWEPSAVEVVDGALWVAGDKQPTLARFCLPGAPTVPPTVHDYVSAHHVPTRLDKIEALAPTGDGGLWVFELKGGERLRCAAPGRCASTPVSTAARQVATEAIEAQGGTVHRGDDGPWTGIEGYAHQGDHAWYGVRQYYQSPDAAVPWSALVHEGPGASLRVLHPGHVLRDGDRAYGISGLAADGEHLWVLWSHESSEDRAGRAGWLTRAELGPDGAPGVPQRCLALPQGKPEGVAVWGDRLVIVFDNDRASKDPKDPGRFRLLPNQDFGLVIAKPACDLGPAF